MIWKKFLNFDSIIVSCLSQHKTDDEDSGNDEPTDLPTDFKDFGFHGQNSSHMNSPNCEAAPRRAEPFRLPVPLLKIDR